ncbi:MAG: hypothetical protein M1828_004422 [Chrysothrix sp. TS-e1954]|nr:MAG: hypothetical protein M1828_004422 [Chrysothrix sp. TS-e1954]
MTNSGIDTKVDPREGPANLEDHVPCNKSTAASVDGLTAKNLTEGQSAAAMKSCCSRTPRELSPSALTKWNAEEVIIEEIPYGANVGYDEDVDIQLPTEYDEAESDVEHQLSVSESPSALDQDCLAERLDKLHVKGAHVRKDSVLSTSNDFARPLYPRDVRKRAHSESTDLAMENMVHPDISHGTKRLRRRPKSINQPTAHQMDAERSASPSRARPRANCLLRPISVVSQVSDLEDAMDVDTIAGG